MTYFTDVSSPDVGTRNDSHAADRPLFRRTSIRGPRNEPIELLQRNDQEQWYGPIAFELSEERSRAEGCPVEIGAQCPDCAAEAKDAQDGDQTVRPQRTPESCQTGGSAAHAAKTDTASQGEFDDVLERHRCSRHHVTTSELCSRVSREGYQAHSRSVRTETAVSPAGWLSMPTRGVWSTAHHRASSADIRTYQRSTYSFSSNGGELLRSKADGDDGRFQDVVTAQSKERDQPSSLCCEVETEEDEAARDAFRVSAETCSVDRAVVSLGPAHRTAERTGLGSCHELDAYIWSNALKAAK